MPDMRRPVRPRGAAVSISEATEAEWQDEVWKLATMLGWKACHFSDSRRQFKGGLVGDARAAGYPDLTMAHPRWGLAFVELKTDKTAAKPTAKQIEWLRALAGGATAVALGDTADATGRVVVHLWRPRDLATVVMPVLQGKPGVPRFYGFDL